MTTPKGLADLLPASVDDSRDFVKHITCVVSPLLPGRPEADCGRPSLLVSVDARWRSEAAVMLRLLLRARFPDHDPDLWAVDEAVVSYDRARVIDCGPFSSELCRRYSVAGRASPACDQPAAVVGYHEALPDFPGLDVARFEAHGFRDDTRYGDSWPSFVRVGNADNQGDWRIAVERTRANGLLYMVYRDCHVGDPDSWQLGDGVLQRVLRAWRLFVHMAEQCAPGSLPHPDICAALARIEIAVGIESGVLPSSVASWRDLRAHVIPDYYGGFRDLGFARRAGMLDSDGVFNERAKSLQCDVRTLIESWLQDGRP